MKIEIQEDGRRYYLVGGTYPVKAALEAADFKWDRDYEPNGAWWTESKKNAEETLEQITSGAIQPACKGCGHAIVDAPHQRAMDGYCGECAFEPFFWRKTLR